MPSSANIKRTVEETTGTRNARKGKIFQTLNYQKIHLNYLNLSVGKTEIFTEKRFGLTYLIYKIKYNKRCY